MIIKKFNENFLSGWVEKEDRSKIELSDEENKVYKKVFDIILRGNKLGKSFSEIQEHLIKFGYKISKSE